ncbi:MAG: MCE family protein [Sporichthyaceae bacterium]
MTGPMSEWGPRPGALRRRGALFLAAITAMIGGVVASYSGALADGVRVDTVTADTGDALVAGSDVKLRGVVVGRVDSIRRKVGSEGAVLGLLLGSDKARSVPAGVTSRILPANVFGQSFVELLPPKRPVGGPIRSGTTIATDTSAETLELNDVFGKLYRVLTAVQPAKLSVALAALAEALAGRGDDINSVIGRSDAYLRELAPSLPDLSADLQGFAEFVTTVSEQTPKLFDSVDDLLVLLRLLVDRQGEFVELLSGGLGLTGNAKELLEKNEKNLVRVNRQSAQIFGAFAKRPQAFSKGFVDLGAFLGGLVVEDGRAALDTVLTNAPLPSYGAADCPRYPGLAGPNCPKDAAAPASARVASDVASLPMLYGGIGPVGSVTDKLLLRQVLVAIDALRGAKAGDVGMLLAGSVLRGQTVLLPGAAK